MGRSRHGAIWLYPIAGFLLAVIGLIGVGQRFGDADLAPRPGEPTILIEVVDYGYHAAVFIPRAALAQAAITVGARRVIAVTDRFVTFSTLEFGWGDEAFYRSVRTIADLQPGLALSAILGLDDKTVLLVVGRDAPGHAAHPSEAHAMIAISPRALGRMATQIELTLAGDALPEELGPGLYGQSLFYRATGHYSLFNVCNHWLARLLVAAGRPINLTLATFSPLLVWQMQ